ncbi:hypothetical protein RJ639_000245 [Escallonia herrerae]|uniref:CASP-like protein n=1 Tax=Escallonia herrerae TaxID=1293975 RepID=A0AA88XAB3_9ASTE|nr:hypothetical protein RJ639_000245 [Escallonia herrerae]
MDSSEAKVMQNLPLKTSKSSLAAQVCLRLLALGATLAAACIMITSKQSVVVFGINIDARYSYSPAFKFLVLANLIACAFSLISLIIVPILARKGSHPASYFYMFLHDLVLMTLLMAGGAAATAIGYVGRYGNSHTGWMAICDNFGKFCDRVTVSVLLSFFGFVLYLFLVIISANRSRQIQV